MRLQNILTVALVITISMLATGRLYSSVASPSARLEAILFARHQAATAPLAPAHQAPAGSISAAPLTGSVTPSIF